MHRRAGVALGDQQFAAVDLQARIDAGQQGRATPGAVVGREDAESGSGLERQARLALLEHEVAGSDEQEVVVGEPVEEGAGLDRLRIGFACRGRLQPRGVLSRPLAHRAPIGRGEADVGDHGADRVGQVGQAVVRLTLEVQPDHRLVGRVGLPGHVSRGRCQVDHPAGGVAPDPQDRVQGQPNDQAAAVECRRDRVDQEGGVRAGQFDHAVAAAPAVCLLHRVVHPQQDLVRLALVEQAPVRGQRADQVGGVEQVEVGGPEIAVVQGQQPLQQAALGRIQILRRIRGQPPGERPQQSRVVLPFEHAPPRCHNLSLARISHPGGIDGGEKSQSRPNPPPVPGRAASSRRPQGLSRPGRSGCARVAWHGTSPCRSGR